MIVNAQETPYDAKADIVAHAKTDEFMKGLCEALGVKPDDFIYTKALELVFSGSSVGPTTNSFGINSITLKSSIPGGSVTTDIKDCTFNLVSEKPIINEAIGEESKKNKITRKWKEDIELEANNETRIFNKRNLGLVFEKVSNEKDENNGSFILKNAKESANKSKSFEFIKFYLSFGFRATGETHNNEIELKIPLKNLKTKILKAQNHETSIKFDFKTNITTGEQTLEYK